MRTTAYANAGIVVGMTRVLIVDDEPDIVYMVKVILRSAGFEVTAVGGVNDAISELSKDDPDLVLLDLRLGDGDGWQVLAHLNTDGRTGRIPVIILTAHGNPSTADRAMREGAKGYIMKPFVASSLLETVRTHVGSS
jgi:CheY-like chemotaxis protein